jgi:uncharacterized membrane protein YhaH (DUF805 family)
MTGIMELSSFLLALVVINLIQIPPVVKILHRAGYSGWWAVLVPISPLNVPVAMLFRTMVAGTHLFAPVLIGLAFVPPVVKILHKTGHSGWWVVLVPISPLNVIGLWFLAYSRWPTVDRPISD